MKRFLLSILFILFPSVSFSSWPGECVQIFYYQAPTATLSQWAYHNITVNGSEINFLDNQYAYSAAGSISIYVNYWTGSRWATQNSLGDIATIDSLNALIAQGAKRIDTPYPVDANFYSVQPGCPIPTCLDNKDKITYNLKQYDNPDSPPNASNVCYEDCQQSSEIIWNDCFAGSCVASVKYTQTGEPCGAAPPATDLTVDPPKRCTDEINKKIQQCGGSLKVLSFDFETCTGECTPDSCGDKWQDLVTKCGGIMSVSDWNSETCIGSCVTDPPPNNCSNQWKALLNQCGGLGNISYWDEKTCSGYCRNSPAPDPLDPNQEASPKDITTEKTTNPDGTSEVKQTTTYKIDNTTYHTTTTTTYDSNGNETGKTITSSMSNGSSDDSDDSENEEPSITVPSSFYTPKYDTSQGLSSAINYQPIFDATNSLKSTAPYQIPGFLLDCIEMVEGKDCDYPPTLSIDILSNLTGKPVNIDLSPFQQVVTVMKFFFSLLCIFMTYKSVMYLFK